MSNESQMAALPLAKTGLPAGTRSQRLSLDKLVIFIVLIALFGYFSMTASNFFTVRNVLTLALQTSTITMMGIGVTFTIITGGIDLSIGSVVALSGTVAVMAANVGCPIWLSMVIGLGSGVLSGLLNGMLITIWATTPCSRSAGSSRGSPTRCSS
jgi:ribose transport system permease protein